MPPIRTRQTAGPRYDGIEGPKSPPLNRKGTTTTHHTANPTVDVQSRSLYQACLAAKTCDELRGKDTVVLDLTGITPLFDYFVITTGNSRRQLHAIAEDRKSTRLNSSHSSPSRMPSSA